MNTPTPLTDSNEEKKRKQQARRRDQDNLGRFKRALDAGTPFEEFPEDLKRWWINRY